MSYIVGPVRRKVEEMPMSPRAFKLSKLPYKGQTVGQALVQLCDDELARSGCKTPPELAEKVDMLIRRVPTLAWYLVVHAGEPMYIDTATKPLVFPVAAPGRPNFFVKITPDCITVGKQTLWTRE